mgnify:CR=1 FL=1
MIAAIFKADMVIKDYKSVSNKFPDAMQAAMNDSAAQAKTYAAKEITDVYNIKSADIKSNFKLIKATNARMVLQITGYGAGISLRRFAATRSKRLTTTQSGVKRHVIGAKIWKSRTKQEISGVFGLSGKLKTVMKRSTSERFPIQKAFGPGVAYMFNDKLKNKTINHIELIFPKILDNKIKFFYD